MNNLTRLLLPFTHGIDAQAIEQTVRVAQSQNAVLVLLALVPVPPQGIRLEHIQQARDIEKIVTRIANRYLVPIEAHEVYSSDIVGSIITEAKALHCDHVLVALRSQKAVLLHTSELDRLLKEYPAQLLLLHLPPQNRILGIFPFTPRDEKNRVRHEIVQVQLYQRKEKKECAEGIVEDIVGTDLSHPGSPLDAVTRTR